MPKLSQVLDRFQPSPIAHIFALAIQREEEGRDLVQVSYNQGDVRQRALLRGRYHQGRTLSELGGEHDVSRERVRLRNREA